MIFVELMVMLLCVIVSLEVIVGMFGLSTYIIYKKYRWAGVAAVFSVVMILWQTGLLVEAIAWAVIISVIVLPLILFKVIGLTYNKLGGSQ
jgi:hypothetical protein